METKIPKFPPKSDNVMNTISCIWLVELQYNVSQT